jgi:hypothetical protein
MKPIQNLISLPVLALALSTPLYAQVTGAGSAPASMSGSMSSSGITNPSGMTSSDNAQARAQSQADQAAAKASGSVSVPSAAGASPARANVSAGYNASYPGGGLHGTNPAIGSGGINASGSGSISGY